MTKHHKVSKHQQEVKDTRESRKFFMILAISVAVLMLLMYLVFR